MTTTALYFCIADDRIKVLLRNHTIRNLSIQLHALIMINKNNDIYSIQPRIYKYQRIQFDNCTAKTCCEQAQDYNTDVLL